MSYNKELNPMQALTESMTPKFAVSYLRVSTRGQAERGGGADEGFSIPAQREANKRKALSMGAMIGKEFVDRGASAKSADRPELQKMLEYVKENADRIDYVIVHKVDRLARNRGDDIDIMRVLRECGVQLVSASESIDDTPAGMLLHGIMSSIAEFYSQNLAAEVKKGMGQKVKNGGTIGRAPLGYLNVRRVDEKGREERTVVLDEERAPLIKLAFEEYATGNWTVADLAEHLAACGLTTRATPKIPSVPINAKALNKVLVNAYYKGVTTYQGVEQAGRHEPIVSPEVWDKVQMVLASHLNGERTRQHPHFLKSSVYCAACGSRLIISNERKKSGIVYPYFVCAGRHSKRVKDCKMRAVLVDVIERKIEEIYDNYQIPSELKATLESYLLGIIERDKQKADTELAAIARQKNQLEHRRKKLLEAHYCDAIPLELLKSEQKQIAKELAAIDREISLHNISYQTAEYAIRSAIELAEDCGTAYRLGSDTYKRLMNQAIFSRFLVSNDLEGVCGVTAEFQPPFNVILGPFMGVFAAVNRAKRNRDANLDKLIKKAERHIRSFFECGVSAFDNSESIETYSTFFKDNSSSKDFLVEMAGVEPASESQLPRLSTSVSGLLKFPPCSAERQALHFGSLLCMAGVKA